MPFYNDLRPPADFEERDFERSELSILDLQEAPDLHMYQIM